MNWRTMSTAQLKHVRQDLQQTIQFQEGMARKGLRTPKLATYNDQLLAVAGELQRRGK